MISTAILCMSLIGSSVGVGMGGGRPQLPASYHRRDYYYENDDARSDCWAVIAASSATVQGRGGGGDVVGTTKSIAMHRAKMTGMKRGIICLSPFGDETMTSTPTECVVGGEEVGMGIGGGGGGGGGRGTTKIASICSVYGRLKAPACACLGSTSTLAQAHPGPLGAQ